MSNRKMSNQKNTETIPANQKCACGSSAIYAVFDQKDIISDKNEIDMNNAPQLRRVRYICSPTCASKLDAGGCFICGYIPDFGMPCSIKYREDYHQPVYAQETYVVCSVEHFKAVHAFLHHTAANISGKKIQYKCHACDKFTESDKYTCQRCNMIFYCSKSCLKRNYQPHKKECGKPKIITNPQLAIKCEKCKSAKCTKVIFDQDENQDNVDRTSTGARRVRGYCGYKCVDQIDFGGCILCGQPSVTELIYKVGYRKPGSNIDDDSDSIDHYYSTCSIAHYNIVDKMVSAGVDGKSKKYACIQCSKELQKIQRCSRCQAAYYCSRECQQQHWKSHKKICDSIASVTQKSENTK